MAKFKQYISGCTADNSEARQLKVGRFELYRLRRRYPWFVTARVVRDKLYGSEDEMVYLSRLFPPTEVQMHRQSELREQIENSVVERFRSLGTYSIPHSEEDGRAESLVSEGVNEDDDDEFYTEELAQIYEQQGLISEARKIYVKLGLLYPKKSVYFAEIISRLDKKL